MKINSDEENERGYVRVYPGKLQLQIEEAFVNVPVENDTTVSDLVRDALNRFGLPDNQIEDHRFVSFVINPKIRFLGPTMRRKFVYFVKFPT